mmetsp:Transcript_16080/g.26109  ORF Transcript_16080/g.26109 Transcript_16080/m.26109 type:complete len:210 (+) Transcript_16080:163-792(+)
MVRIKVIRNSVLVSVIQVLDDRSADDRLSSDALAIQFTDGTVILDKVGNDYNVVALAFVIELPNDRLSIVRCFILLRLLFDFSNDIRDVLVAMRIKQHVFGQSKSHNRINVIFLEIGNASQHEVSSARIALKEEEALSGFLLGRGRNYGRRVGTDIISNRKAFVSHAVVASVSKFCTNGSFSLDLLYIRDDSTAKAGYSASRRQEEQDR